MSLIDAARDALKEIPISDILRERLSLALDQSAGLERQVAVLQTENGKLQAKLEIVTQDYHNIKSDLERLKAEHSEEVRIHKTIEFRKGKRTGGKWSPFCPKCQKPLGYGLHKGETIYYCSGNCGWLQYCGEALGILAQQVSELSSPH